MFAFNNVPVGRLDATVNAWSPDDALQYGVESWSLRQMQTQDDAVRDPSLARGLRIALAGVKTAYAPNVAVSSAAVVPTENLKKNKIQLRGTSIYRNKEAPADGVFLNRDEAVVMSGSGCPIIIATAGRRMVVAHAGRDSLIERSAVLGMPTRRHVSVVNAIIEALLGKGEPLNGIVMCMLCSVPAELFEHRFDHPQYGSYNHALVNFVDARWPGCTTRRGNVAVFLNLESVFTAQALEAGVWHTWAMSSLRDYTALAHTRDGKCPSRRNLFVVKRNT